MIKIINSKEKLHQPCALVTGGAQRIGRAICLDLASRGFNIALHYHRSKAEAKKLSKEIIKLGVQCELFECDLSQEKQVRTILEKVHSRFKLLSVLINNASIFIPSQFDLKDLPLLEAHYKVHLHAPFILSSEFARIVKNGVIINMLDTKVVKSKTTHVAYILSKKSLYELTKLMAISFAPNIRVNAIAPGIILPPPHQGEAYLKQRAQQIPLCKVGQVEHITSAVNFLLNHEFITGQTLFVDGGEHLV